MMRRYCVKCGKDTVWIRGKALENTASYGVLDFPGDTKPGRGQTISMTGPPKMVDCIKCVGCGRSIR